MDESEVIDITSEGSEAEGNNERREFFEPIVQRVVDALGGYEDGVYCLGDEVNGCLKDLKKLWRKDETDDDRTIARLFWESRVLINDLIPILMVTAGKGMVEDKRAIAVADLLTAMTWPIDVAEELKELDDELDKGADYTQLLQSHLHYKAALLKPGVMEALFGIMLPPLAKPPKERTERDGQVANVVLHLFRNLAFIKDPPANMLLSSDQAEFSKLQSKLICALSETKSLELLLTIAANVDKDPLFDNWNTLVLDILYLLFRSVKPISLAVDQKKKATDTLHQLLAKENSLRRQQARHAPTRHSRFGTTITVQLNPNKKPRSSKDGNEADSEPSSSKGEAKSFVLHRQTGINRDVGTIWDMSKRQKSKKSQTLDELAKEANLSLEARIALQTFATDFLESCFNPFLSTLLKDIRSEKPKITDKDNLRLLYVTKWFLEYFLVMRSRHIEKASGKWSLGQVAEVVEQSWIIWVLRRMREAVEEKPKAWTELQTGTECLTQLLLLVDTMASDEIGDENFTEAADTLQHQLVYSGEITDIAFESLRTYKEGTQSLAYLNSSVNMGYALFKVLERWVKKNSGTGDLYIRKKKSKRRKKKTGNEVPEEEEIEQPEEEEIVHETMVTLEGFEMKFAQEGITHTLLAYLARYKEFTGSENLKQVLSLMHRQAVKAKAEGLYFQVSTLNLFKNILTDQKTFPREQPYKDLVNFINYILRQFFKALEKEPFLAVEAFFPKNRGHWKQYSSWEPEKKSKPEKATIEDTRPQEVQVKKGYSWSDQVGIAIAALVETDQKELVTWVQEILSTVIGQRQRIIEETDDKNGRGSGEENDERPVLKLDGPSVDTIAKFTDYLIPYLSDESADAANKNSYLKLLFRLSKFYILDEDADELEWYVPAAILPKDLQATYNVIAQFLETPYDLEGKKVSQLLTKKRRRRRRVRPVLSDEDEGSDSDGEKARRERKREKRQEEKEKYKSAQFIEDSDEEFSHNLDDFMALERARREKTAAVAASLGEGRSGTMKSQGTKKRRRKAGENAEKKKRQKRDDTAPDMANEDMHEYKSSESEKDDDEPEPARSVTPESVKERPRPKPRPIPKRVESAKTPSPDDGSSDEADHSDKEITTIAMRKKGRLVLSDDDDE
ncbi:topoisomerase 1-associated factor 1 [Moniliophthora roreri MCA 2997]|uniref:Topoisomerase 1-associated factor 1 n=1 Tax=Moniliophthora roreri (strain MCA 2997) TaxID=1381753 RepID=V2X792_MONRO|nr:topoisomerase 1-associated factor 1 [Moniliophthora roreri MCA 2997]